MHDGLKREYEVMTLGIAIWHVSEYAHFAIDDISHGHFHEGDTYVVRWHYMISQKG